jgi:hypothetical protein
MYADELRTRVKPKSARGEERATKQQGLAAALTAGACAIALSALFPTATAAVGGRSRECPKFRHVGNVTECSSIGCKRGT